MITMTEKAAAQIKVLTGDKGNGDALRLAVEKGGCSGQQYTMTLGTRREDDEVVEKDGAQVVVDRESLAFLKEVVVDYDDSLSGAGFRILNPNAARSCGCGKSFEPNPGA